jgi:TPR repeat protein
MKSGAMRAIGGFGLGLLLAGAGHAQALEDDAGSLARASAANQGGDFKTSVGIYQAMTDRGSAVGPAMLGLMYWSGRGVAADRGRACDLFAVAEQRGDPSGTELLADCYFHGEGRERPPADSPWPIARWGTSIFKAWGWRRIPPRP